MKTFIPFFIFILNLQSSSFSQSYFNKILGNETTPIIGYNFIVTDDNNIIVPGLKIQYFPNDTIYSAYLVKLSETGEILTEKDSVLKDTIIIHREIAKGENGHFWIYSVLSNIENLEEQYSYIFSEYDESFNRIKKFELTLPDSLYFNYYDVNFNTTLRYNNNQLIWADRACVKGKWEYYGFIYKFNTNGDSLNFMIDKWAFFHDIDIYDNETFYSTSEKLSDYYMTINKMKLSDLSVDSIFDTANLPDLEGMVLNDEPTYLEFLTDTTFVFSAVDLQTQVNLSILDTAFNVLKNVTYGTDDFREFSAQNEGLAVSSDKKIFTINSSMFVNTYMVTKLDDDLNIIWERFFDIEGGEWLHSIKATNDGGCIILGELIMWGKRHISILKTDENGSISGITDELSKKISRELILYPNPGNNQLNIRTAVQRIGGEFKIYDISGKLVFQEHITQNITTIDTKQLASGTYIYNYTHHGKEIESGKWVKR